MGTRALITKNGKPFIATHWDGYPTGLGADLLNKKTISEIIKVAKKHQIDFADSSVQKNLNAERIKYLAKKHNLSIAEIKKGTRRGNITEAEDWEIETIKGYGDWAEYQYDLRNGKWYFRQLSGAYPQSLKSAGDLKPLTKEVIEKLKSFNK